MEGFKYELRSLAGRTHQLRVHWTRGLLARILDDDLCGAGHRAALVEGLSDALHLHARATPVASGGRG